VPVDKPTKDFWFAPQVHIGYPILHPMTQFGSSNQPKENYMGNRMGTAVLALSLMLSFGGTASTDNDKGKNGRIRAKLVGLQEVPAVSSKGSGEFLAEISNDDSKIDYTLTWKDLEGATVQQAHIHFGQHYAANGGIAVFFCSNLPSPPASTPTCPGPASGELKGVITAANVIGPAGQGIAAGEFAELLRAIRTGNSYVNVHTDKHPGGEIRAQLNGRGKGLIGSNHSHDKDDDEEDDD